MAELLYLQQLTAAAKDSIKADVAEAGGEAEILIHPFDLGITEKEREESIAIGERWAIACGAEPRPREQVRAEGAGYIAQLENFLRGSAHRVGFVFEAVEYVPIVGDAPEGLRLPRYIAHLRDFGSRGRTWVVIPTQWGRADPFGAAWEEILRALADLGIKKISLGGCYYLLAGGYPVNPDFSYSCVMHAGAEMLASGLFEQVIVLEDMTYVHRVD